MGASLRQRFGEALAVLSNDKGLVGTIAQLGGQNQGMLTGILQQGEQIPQRNVRDILVYYSRLPWLRAIAHKIAFSIASTPWETFMQTRNGSPMRAKRLQSAQFVQRAKLRAKIMKTPDLGLKEVDSPLLELLENFNPVHTGLAGFKIIQTHLDLVGNAFLLKQRAGGPGSEPIALWPLVPFWITKTPTPKQPWYRVNWRAWQANIPEEDVIWFCDSNPANPYSFGTGTAQALGDELETDEYAAKLEKYRFINRAVPDILITAEGMHKDETLRLENDWNRMNRGFFNSLRPYFLSRKVEVKELGQSFRNLQLVQLREFERNTIVQVFGVPPEILGIIEKSNRATIDAADFIFSRWVMVPRLELLRTVMQERLVLDFDERLILDYVSPVEEDKQYILEVAKAVPEARNLNEWRELQELEADPELEGVRVVRTSVNVRRPQEDEPSGEPVAPAPPLSAEPSTTSDGDDSDDGTDDKHSAEPPENSGRSYPFRVNAKAAKAIRELIH